VGFDYFHYAKTVFRPAGLESVFSFVTSTCNSLCRTCFYWNELNQGARVRSVVARLIE
jgi:hypothetical protein